MNSFGNKFKITVYGASHEDSMGVIIDGVVPGIKINYSMIDEDLSRRRPKDVGTTKRVEEDIYIVKNGVFNGFTTGAPINIEIPNTNTRTKDYSNIIDHPRPSHADFVANIKYNGFNDYRGGGIFSGRLTACIVVAGSIAKMITPYIYESKIIKLGSEDDAMQYDEYLDNVLIKGDSVGGEIKLTIKNVPVGLGDPLFNKLDARLSYMLMNIPGIKAVSFGSKISKLVYGSKYNDQIINEEGKTKTNHAGGIVGGISNGNDIVINVSIKPTSSIGISQDTFNFKSKELKELKIKGRHDVAFVRRMPVILENACAIVLADYYLSN